MKRYSDKAIKIIKEMYRERLQFNGEYLQLIDAAYRLAEYEDTGLPPEICAEYKKFEDHVISRGLTFRNIIEVIEAEELRRRR